MVAPDEIAVGGAVGGGVGEAEVFEHDVGVVVDDFAGVEGGLGVEDVLI